MIAVLNAGDGYTGGTGDNDLKSTGTPITRIIDANDVGKTFYIFPDRTGSAGTVEVIYTSPSAAQVTQIVNFLDHPVGFRLLPPETHENVKAGDRIDIGVAAFGMMYVTSATVTLKTPEGGWSTNLGADGKWHVETAAANTGLFTKAGTSTSTQLVLNASSGAVNGDALLGTFTLVAPTGFDVTKTAAFEIESINLTLETGHAVTGSPFTTADNEIGLKTRVNPQVKRLWTDQRGIFPDEGVTLFAEVDPNANPGVLTAKIRRYNQPVSAVKSVTLALVNGSDPPLYMKQLSGADFSTSADLGLYYIDLDFSGVASPISGAGGFALAHTIFAYPEPMLVEPDGSTPSVPLLVEDDGSGYLVNRITGSDKPAVSLTTRVMGTGGLQVDPTVARTLKGKDVSGVTSSANMNQGWYELSGSVDAAALGRPAILASLKLGLKGTDESGAVELPISQVDGRVAFGLDVLVDGNIDDGVAAVPRAGLEVGRGDVDGNGRITTLDPVLVLMETVGKINLETPGLYTGGNVEVASVVGDAWTIPARAARNAEVTGRQGISPLDASYLLRRRVGSIAYFPVESDYFHLWRTDELAPLWDKPALTKPVGPALAVDRTVSLGTVEARDGLVTIPVRIDEMTGVLAGRLVLEFDPTKVEPAGVRSGELTRDYLFAEKVDDGELRVSFAGADWQSGQGALAQIQLRPLVEGGTSLAADVRLAEVLLNEGGTPSRIDGASPLPRTLALHPNFPNPFNPSTALRFDLPQDGPVELSVFNVLGQQVRTLVNGSRQAGYYRLEWDGMDDAGQPVASGTYLTRLQTREGVLVHKMLMVK